MDWEGAVRCGKGLLKGSTFVAERLECWENQSKLMLRKILDVST